MLDNASEEKTRPNPVKASCLREKIYSIPPSKRDPKVIENINEAMLTMNELDAARVKVARENRVAISDARPEALVDPVTGEFMGITYEISATKR